MIYRSSCVRFNIGVKNDNNSRRSNNNNSDISSGSNKTKDIINNR